MSSMTTGSDDDAHKDELELDHSDAEERVSTNGHIGEDEDAVALNDDPIDDEPQLEGDIQDHEDGDASEFGLDLVSGNARPIPTPSSRDLGVLDDSGSIPDDSPSVQVSAVLIAKSLIEGN